MFVIFGQAKGCPSIVREKRRVKSKLLRSIAVCDISTYSSLPWPKKHLISSSLTSLLYSRQLLTIHLHTKANYMNNNLIEIEKGRSHVIFAILKTWRCLVYFVPFYGYPRLLFSVFFSFFVLSFIVATLKRNLLFLLFWSISCSAYLWFSLIQSQMWLQLPWHAMVCRFFVVFERYLDAAEEAASYELSFYCSLCRLLKCCYCLT